MEEEALWRWKASLGVGSAGSDCPRPWSPCPSSISMAKCPSWVLRWWTVRVAVSRSLVSANQHSCAFSLACCVASRQWLTSWTWKPTRQKCTLRELSSVDQGSQEVMASFSCFFSEPRAAPLTPIAGPLVPAAGEFSVHHGCDTWHDLQHMEISFCLPVQCFSVSWPQKVSGCRQVFLWPLRTDCVHSTGLK